MFTKKSFKKIVAALLALTLAIGIIPTSNLKAASSKSKYIKEFKLFIKTDGTYNDAEKWCESQSKKDGETWKAIKGNLDEGANGSFKDSKGVFLCYKTTTEPSEAVTDIAVMNERGNYSEGAYEDFVEQQKDMYTDMVSGLKEMIESYRNNYKNKIKTSIQAHDMLNGYIDDDSGKKIGDLLLTISDTDLRDLLLQANGEAVTMIQNQLALAAESGKNTWMDRMEKLGSYNTLRQQALKAYNNNAAKADNALDKKYHQAASDLLSSWPDIYETIKYCKKFAEQNGLTKMRKKEATKWIKNNTDNLKASTYNDLTTAMEILSIYKYDGATLFEYFNRSYDKMKENIKELYPLVASLNESQLEALSKGVSFVQLIQFAADATVVNNYKAGKAEIIDKGGNFTKQETENIKNNTEKMQEKIVDKVQEKPISIYEGVDRELYKGGVAITTTAANYSNGSPIKWSDRFVDSGAFQWTTVGMWVGALFSGVMAFVFKQALYNETLDFVETVFYKAISTDFNILKLEKANFELLFQYRSFDGLYNRALYGNLETKIACREAIGDLYEKGVERANTYGFSTTSMNWARYLKIGFTIFTIALCIANIVLTVITLVDYYNRDHLDIPHHMVDLAYNEDKETSYLAYKSVLDNNGNYGDVNGGGGKQWLGLYQTYDEEAGGPILAPEDIQGDIKVQYHDTTVPQGYSPLHLFGKPNAVQNLTYADGEAGWSYNDAKHGIYLVFKRDKALVDNLYAGSAVTKGHTVLIGGAGALIGLIAGMAGGLFIGKRRRQKFEE